MLISHLKLIMIHLRSIFNDKAFSNLMKSALESPAKLIDRHLEVVDVWNRKKRKTGKLDILY